MPFNENDLKRLKDTFFNKRDFQIALTVGQSIAVFARLEAAEAVCQQVEIWITKDTPKMFRTKELLEAWREAAGKQNA